MYTIHEPNPAPVAMSEQERDEVRAQLNRMLETHHFKNSRRYPALLRFIVEEALEGRGEYLKERLLGVRVFDRPADYDTAADPVVRVTIAEIRKRIAQYYHDEDHDAEIRIELLPGRYAPEFRTRTARRDIGNPVPDPLDSGSLLIADPPTAAAAPSSVPARALAQIPTPSPTRTLARIRHALFGRSPYIVVAGLVLLCVAAVPVAQWFRPSALEQLWSPILAGQHPILFCVPTDVGKKRGPTGEPTADSTVAGLGSRSSDPVGPTFLDHEALGENVVYSDMLATLKIANVLAVNHRDYHARLNVATTLEDLRQGPAILIGGLDNQWTMRALAPLRFHFAGSDEDRYWIADTRNPEDKSRSLDLKLQYGSVTRDYAIIARLHNDQTGQPEIIVAGIGMSGTAAAGEFIGDERWVKQLQQRIGRGFKDHDFEAVLSTDVVNGMAGAPKILDVAVW